MNSLRILYHLMRADFLERVRRYSFLMMALFTVSLTYFFVPGMDAIVYPIVVFGGYRPIYNSAWIGLAVTLLMAEFFLLFGFYMVKGAVERDRQTGVGEIIAATPISKPMYTLGKWLSNLAVLAAMVGVIIVTSGLLQWLRGEDMNIDVWQLAAPMLIILLPSLAMVAALAVLFDCIGWLRGGLGNVFYVMVYSGLVLSTDFQGVQTVWPSVYQACSAVFPHCNRVRQIDLDSTPLTNLATFRYEGMSWMADSVIARLGFVLAGIAVALLAALFFHRFDPARVGKGLFEQIWSQLKRAILAYVVQPAGDEEQANDEPAATQAAHLTPLEAQTHGGGLSAYWQMLRAEIRLTFKGVWWSWYIIAVILVGATLLVDLQMAHLFLLPVAWLWPLFRWSGLGTREVQTRTELIVFSGPNPLRRHFVTTWLVGVLVTFALGGGVLARLALTGQGLALVSACIGALFVPTLALACGCWSGGGKLFEAAYMFFWYMVSIQGLVELDFMGRFPSVNEAGVPWIYAAVTVLLFGAAAIGRRRQIRQ